MKELKNNSLYNQYYYCLTKTIKNICGSLPYVYLMSVLTAFGSHAAERDQSIVQQDTDHNDAHNYYDISLLDVQPEFPGGIDALYQWLNENIPYPEEVVRNNIKGKLIVEFIIGTDGLIEETNILLRKHPVLDKEVLRVIKNMPRWKPGEDNGKKVKVSYVLPILFGLTDE